MRCHVFCDGGEKSDKFLSLKRGTILFVTREYKEALKNQRAQEGASVYKQRISGDQTPPSPENQTVSIALEVQLKQQILSRVARDNTEHLKELTLFSLCSSGRIDDRRAGRTACAPAVEFDGAVDAAQAALPDAIGGAHAEAPRAEGAAVEEPAPGQRSERLRRVFQLHQTRFAEQRPGKPLQHVPCQEV